MAKRKNDDGRGPVYQANDGTYHATAKARDAYENRGALKEWLGDAVGSSIDDVTADDLVDRMVADGATFLTLLRKAGVRATRGSRKTAEKKAA